MRFMKNKITQRLFFKKYDHCTTIQVVPEFNWKRSKKNLHPTESIVLFTLRQQFPNADIKTSTRNTYSGRGWRNRRHYSGKLIIKNSIYYTDPVVGDYIETQFSNSLLVVEKPRDAAHAELLKTTKMITRQKLFLNKYRWVAKVKPRFKDYSYTTQHIQDMADYIKKEMPHLVANDNYSHRGCYNASFYFSEASDLVLFKMVWNEYINDTTGITLLSEIEPDDSDVEVSENNEAVSS